MPSGKSISLHWKSLYLHEIMIHQLERLSHKLYISPDNTYIIIKSSAILIEHDILTRHLHDQASSLASNGSAYTFISKLDLIETSNMS